MNENRNTANIAAIQTDVGYIKGSIQEMKVEIRTFKDYVVSKDEFIEYKSGHDREFIVYKGVVGATGLAVVGYLVNAVLNLVGK